MTTPDALRSDDLSVNLPAPPIVLAIGAHPDDVEFGCGATLAKWAVHGAVVHHLVLTDGSKGSWDPTQAKVELVAERQREQRAAAAALGATGTVHFLGQVDGELDSTMTVRGEVARVIRQVRPNIVLGHDPWRRYRLHPDHRHAGWLTVDGCVAARDPHFFPEHDLRHHRPDWLLLFEADEPNHVEDVVGHVGAKVMALLEHRSQFASTMAIDSHDDGTQLAAFIARVENRLQEQGALADLPLGEAFRRIEL